jgi:hypothetical protein
LLRRSGPRRGCSARQLRIRDRLLRRHDLLSTVDAGLVRRVGLLAKIGITLADLVDPLLGLIDTEDGFLEVQRGDRLAILAELL